VTIPTESPAMQVARLRRMATARDEFAAKQTRDGKTLLAVTSQLDAQALRAGANALAGSTGCR
jgi:hypothetical protein